jgi:predicted MPP superfamily phosphohydrolase
MKWVKYSIFISIFFALISFCFEDKPFIQVKNNKTRSEEQLDFFVLGDWGKKGDPQNSVANAMSIEADISKPEFILSVGDNFYPAGVKSTKDKHWQETFEAIYSSESLKTPWYSAFGNHDYMGKIKPQLEYHKINPRWMSTERYYSFEKKIPNSDETVHFIVIDTNPFDGSLSRFGHSDLWKQNKKKQLEWLENTLKSCTSSWIIVVGHHPLFTTGMRRNKMLDVRATFLPLFEKYKVDVYFSGHEHDLQYQIPDGHTHYFVSGAGSDKRGVTTDSIMTKFAASQYGFINVQLNKDTMKVNFINQDNSVIYKTQIINE